MLAFSATSAKPRFLSAVHAQTLESNRRGDTEDSAEAAEKIERALQLKGFASKVRQMEAFEEIEAKANLS